MRCLRRSEGGGVARCPAVVLYKMRAVAGSKRDGRNGSLNGTRADVCRDLVGVSLQRWAQRGTWVGPGAPWAGEGRRVMPPCPPSSSVCAGGVRAELGRALLSQDNAATSRPPRTQPAALGTDGGDRCGIPSVTRGPGETSRCAKLQLCGRSSSQALDFEVVG